MFVFLHYPTFQNSSMFLVSSKWNRFVVPKYQLIGSQFKLQNDKISISRLSQFQRSLKLMWPNCVCFFYSLGKMKIRRIYTSTSEKQKEITLASNYCIEAVNFRRLHTFEKQKEITLASNYCIEAVNFIGAHKLIHFNYISI